MSATDDTKIYTGEMFKGKAHGKGVEIVKETEEKYEGTFAAGYRHGQGKLTFSSAPSALVYDGDFHLGQMHGKGKLTKPGPNPKNPTYGCEVYVGEFMLNDFHGEGTYTFATGGSYSGQWCKSMMHGKGRYVESDRDGDVYVGDYYEDQRHGFGVYTSANGAVYEGEWCKGKMHGTGKHTDSLGNVWNGAWLENKKQGFGRWEGANGEIAEGDWSDDERTEDVRVLQASGTRKSDRVEEIS